MFKPLFTALLCIIVLLISCAPDSLPEDFDAALQDLKPDRRSAVFTVEHLYSGGNWEITVTSSEPEFQSQVETLIKRHFPEGNAKLDFNLLPGEELGDSTVAVVNVSVAILRRKPGYANEQVDQVLMGMPLRLLKKQRYWYLVQTPYKYLGWMTRGSFQRMTPDELARWEKRERMILDVNYTQVHEKPSETSAVVCDAVLGAKFVIRGQSGQWLEVEMPDGRSGFIPAAYFVSSRPDKPQRGRIIARARTMMGIPYMWGGHSVKGLDCSGFTSTVFRMEGMQLPRDANMQVNLGEEIIPDEDYGNILAGDLVFFGPKNRITHVGICMGGSYFIHASGDVHINSLDEKDPLFNGYRKRSFQHIKRIIKD